ncbi:zinc ribbon domain-containing protein [Streptomyces sp. NBC_01497]|uniref:zinc ribbon domain-containing protein n=1 Tax=Streptomyces sp. NBC_01497 TaxID=2903885 RepID=UPI002E32A2B4|nr:zinc ribbon domain-containing protein [Streptomyces sp. NBC_01497]
MILFGTRTYLYQLAILTLVCGRCGNPASHTLRKRVMKFTLFFIPLFPISTKHATQCSFCGAEQQVPKQQAEGLLATIAQDAGTAVPAGQPGAAAPAQRTGHGQQGGPYGQQGGGAPAPQQRNPYQN